MSIYEMFDIPYQQEDMECPPVLAEASKISINGTTENVTIVECTYNYPRTKIFRRLAYKSQVKIYTNHVAWVKKALYPMIKEVSYHIENCADGLPHCHVIYYCAPLPHYPEGLVMDVVKQWKAKLPINPQKLLEYSHYSATFRCFKSPSILVQYSNTPERLQEWRAYCTKEEL